MAFLDNSGDIILDAVLTDTGRMRLAKGDGSFRIKYFALSDDEIDYTLYNRDHVNGGPYFDLEIMQTPILEAFTDNRASLKHKLLTINNRQLLHLPVLRLNVLLSNTLRMDGTIGGASGENMFGVTVNASTSDSNKNTRTGPDKTGVMDGLTPRNSESFIRIDQGLIGTVENKGSLSGDSIDSAYLIEIDHRLGSIVSYHGVDASSTVYPEPSFIDDDQIATYFISDRHSGDFVTALEETGRAGQTPIDGRKGTKLRFKISSGVDLADSDVLFNKIGKTTIMDTVSHKVIDTVVRITGYVTGRRIDIPVRFFKQA